MTWQQVSAHGATQPAGLSPRLDPGHAIVNGRALLMGGLATADAVLADAWSLPLGSIASWTFFGVSSLSPPLQPGVRFDYTGVIDVPAASFQVVYTRGSVHYRWNDGPLRAVASTDTVSFLPLPRRARNTLVVWTPDGVHTFRLSAAAGAGLLDPPPALKLHVYWTGAADVWVRGLTARSASSPWQTVAAAGLTVQLQLADSPAGNDLQLLTPQDGALYSIRVAASGGCHSGAQHSAHLRYAAAGQSAPVSLPVPSLSGQDWTVCM